MKYIFDNKIWNYNYFITGFYFIMFSLITVFMLLDNNFFGAIAFLSYSGITYIWHGWELQKSQTLYEINKIKSKNIFDSALNNFSG